MEERISTEKYGVITYTEKAFSGKSEILVENLPLIKTGKRTYTCKKDGVIYDVSYKGSYMSGVTLSINGEKIRLVRPCAWYEILLAFMTFAILLVWGNLPALCKIIPISGGLLGGAISGGGSIIALAFIKQTKSIWIKIAIGISALVIAFGLCFLSAYLIILAGK